MDQQFWGGGSAPFLGRERGPHLTQSRLGRGLSPYQVAYWFLQPFGYNRYEPTIGKAVPLGGEGEGAGSPSNTVCPGPRPTRTPIFILIHSTAWPQCTNVTDRQDRQTRQQTDSIGEPFYKRSPKNSWRCPSTDKPASSVPHFPLMHCWSRISSSAFPTLAFSMFSHFRSTTRRRVRRVFLQAERS